VVNVLSITHALYNTSYVMVAVLLVEETGVPEENHRPAASYLQTLSHNTVYLALSVDVREIYPW
jgi:hypothetical protein